jgi:hypothetical protein
MIAIIAVIIGGALAYSVTSSNVTTSPTMSERTPIFYVRVINASSGVPLEGVFINAGALNSTKDVDIALRNFVCCGPNLPGAPALYGCSYAVPNGAIVQEGNGKVAIFQNGSKVKLPPCPEKRYITNGTVWITITPENARYYLLFVQYQIYTNSYHDVVQICEKKATYVAVARASPFIFRNF